MTRNSENGNTVTIQKCKQKGSVSGFDNTPEQEASNVICTHPSTSCVVEEYPSSAATGSTTDDSGDSSTKIHNKVVFNYRNFFFLFLFFSFSFFLYLLRIIINQNKKFFKRVFLYLSKFEWIHANLLFGVVAN